MIKQDKKQYVLKQILTTDTMNMFMFEVKQIEVFTNTLDGVKRTSIIYQFCRI